MNKKVLIIVALLLVLGGGGYFFMNSKKTSSNQSVVADTFTSIKDALTKSLSLKCEYTDETGRKSSTFIKAGAIRSDFVGQTDKESGSTIFKDKKIYIWMKGEKNGFIMTVEDPLEATPASKTEGSNSISELEKYKNDCKPAVVPDSLFTPPTDVTFVNPQELMKNPAGFVIPSIEVPSE